MPEGQKYEEWLKSSGQDGDNSGLRNGSQNELPRKPIRRGSATEHPTPPGAPCALLSPSRSGVGLSLLGGGLLGGGYPLVGESIQPVGAKAWAGVGLDVSGLQQFIN